MTTAALYNCHNCGRQYNIKVLKKCPVCQTPFQYIHTPEDVPSTPLAQSVHSQPVQNPVSQQAAAVQPVAATHVWSSQKMAFARNATVSANTVDLYGQIIQIVGYIIAGLTSIFFWFIWGPENDMKLFGFIAGIVVGALTAWGYQVVGALYRMIANYVLFRTTQ